MASPLIPGLPEEVAEQCLLRIPFPYIATARSVSSAWNRLLSDSSFQLTRPSVSPYLVVAAFRRPVRGLQWFAFDPTHRIWLPPLPAMPVLLSHPSSFSSASLAGSLFVLNGPTGAFSRYDPLINRWSDAAPAPTPRSCLALGAVGGRILSVGGGAAAQVYDPDLDAWSTLEWGALGIEKPYDAAVAAGKMFVTEGWRWPFDRAPRGQVYGASGADPMREGMREGWTGASAVVGGRIMVVEEWGEGRVKIYRSEDDSWKEAEGGGVPRGVGKPVAVCGGAAEVYVVGEGMAVAVGRIWEDDGGAKGWTVEWEVVECPVAWGHFCPCRCHVIYA